MLAVTLLRVPRAGVVVGLWMRGSLRVREQNQRQHFEPIEATTYDWVHTFLQGGVLNAEVEGFLSAGAPFGITRGAIQTFLKDGAWRFPQSANQKQRQAHRIFDERRRSDKEPEKLKCSCSELLGVYGMLRLTQRLHSFVFLASPRLAMQSLTVLLETLSFTIAAT